jgi:hypothetical protein
MLQIGTEIAIKPESNTCCQTCSCLAWGFVGANLFTKRGITDMLYFITLVRGQSLTLPLYVAATTDNLCPPPSALQAVLTQYIGAHRGLTSQQRQQINLKEGLLAPVLASVALFGTYLLIRFTDLNLATLLNGYFWWVHTHCTHSYCCSWIQGTQETSVPGKGCVTHQQQQLLCLWLVGCWAPSQG